MYERARLRVAAPAIGALLILAACSSSVIPITDDTPAEYPFILFVEELEIYDMVLDLTGNAETLEKKTWIDGTHTVDYEYDRLESPQHSELFYSVTLDLESDEGSAKTTYETGLMAILAASKAIGRPCTETQSPISWGDEMYYSVRKQAGDPTGFVFSARKQNKVYTIILTGLYSTDHSLISDLVYPKLLAIDEMQ